MITIVSDKNEIKKLHTKFHNKLDRYFTERIKCFVGWQGGGDWFTVKYSPELDLWTVVQRLKNRYWNGFGVGRPSDKGSNHINVEINFPYRGIHRDIAGAFGVEDNGNILVLHRGRVRGVSKKLFADNFRGDFLTARDGERESQFALIGQVDSEHLPGYLATFISEIKRIKNLQHAKNSNNFDGLDEFKFSKERWGQSKHVRHGITSISRTHGIVVNALASELEKRGYKVGNRRPGNIDLFIYKNNRITTLFEIKRSDDTQALCAAVGQLIIYSIPIRKSVDLIIVLPDKLNETVQKRLAKLGIAPLYYNWNGGSPEFVRLREILKGRSLNK